MKTFDEYEKFLTEKTISVEIFLNNSLNKLLSMFEYKNLPDEIPVQYMELYLLEQGACFFTQVNGKYYVFTGGYGGDLDAYYRPLIFTVNNPWAKVNKDFIIDKDGVLISNDTKQTGILPLLKKYAVLLCENEISIRSAIINTRMQTILSTGDDKTNASAKTFLDKLKKGDLATVSEQTFFDALHVWNNSVNSNYLTQHIELEQYLKASFYNEIGLNSNYNMKREYIGRDENSLTNDVLLPYVTNMLNCRKIAVEKINALFSLNISVDFSSTWKSLNEENEKEIRNSESQPEETEAPENPEKETKENEV